MTAQLSRERLEEIKEFGCARIIKPISDEEILALVDMALAGMDSKPVGVRSRWKDEGNGAGSWLYFTLNRYDALASDPTRDCELLYAEPPAPVAVPDAFIMPELATLTNINKLCPLDVNLSQTDFATGWNDCRWYALNNGELPPIIKGVNAGAQGWNACRAAMLNAGPVTGWIKCSERMPPENDQDIWLWNGSVQSGYIWNGDRFVDWNEEYQELHGVTHWMPMPLPAAPEQE